MDFKNSGILNLVIHKRISINYPLIMLVLVMYSLDIFSIGKNFYLRLS